MGLGTAIAVGGSLLSGALNAHGADKRADAVSDAQRKIQEATNRFFDAKRANSATQAASLETRARMARDNAMDYLRRRASTACIDAGDQGANRFADSLEGALAKAPQIQFNPMESTAGSRLAAQNAAEQEFADRLDMQQAATQGRDLSLQGFDLESGGQRDLVASGLSQENQIDQVLFQGQNALNDLQHQRDQITGQQALMDAQNAGAAHNFAGGLVSALTPAIATQFALNNPPAAAGGNPNAVPFSPMDFRDGAFDPLPSRGFPAATSAPTGGGLNMFAPLPSHGFPQGALA